MLPTSIFTQAVRPGFKFRLRFFYHVQSQIAVWSVKHTRHLCMRTAHGIYRSCRREKLARIPWFQGRWNHIQTNTPFEADQHYGTLSVFGTGRSASLTRDQFTSEHFEWIYQESCHTKGAIIRGYQLFNLIKSIFTSVIVFLDVIVNQAESQLELKNVWATRVERLENLFTNVSVRVHLSKTLWETSLSIIKIKSRTKQYFLVIFL